MEKYVLTIQLSVNADSPEKVVESFMKEPLKTGTKLKVSNGEGKVIDFTIEEDDKGNKKANELSAKAKIRQAIDSCASAVKSKIGIFKSTVSETYNDPE